MRLIIGEGSGDAREVVVDSMRFTIGRSPDNDLVVEDTNLSRRHALIECFDGIMEISDCGSRNGTELNSVAVTGGAVLNDGDVITLGGSTEITVRVGAKREAESRAKGSVAAAAVSVSGQKAKPARKIAKRAKGKKGAASASVPPPRIGRIEDSEWASSQGWLSAPVIAACSVIVILLFAVALLIFTHRSGTDPQRVERRPRTTGSESTAGQTVNEENPNSQQSTPDNGASNDNASTPGSSASMDQVESAAGQVMLRISSDDRAYSFSEKALHDISQRIEEYRALQSTRDAILAMQRGGNAVATQARREGLEPGLVVYTGLLMTDGGRSGRDPVAAAREMIPNLLALRATFGSGDADSSLIVLAAYKEGGVGTKQSHPLLERMRRLVRNPLVQRNIWYLHERGGLGDDAYNFVVRFIALGAIAQNPRQFGVAADPLTF
ncbi:MAG TPA: FHA domain-containing protein [Pyrinomonadaceae bacterium]|nr:FHA domain-containing protein [Pyrinomonadaceae bacterium]